MSQTRRSPEYRIASSEYGSDLGYLVREFEIDSERKKAEERVAVAKAKEDAVGTKRHFAARLFEKRHAPR